jgi:hypothetical protein
MSSDLKNPPDGFKNFLERATQDGWITQYRWESSDSFEALRKKLGKKRKEGFTRTHKRGTDGVWWGLELESDFGSSAGVDLEILISRPILDNPAWILERLGLGRSLNARQILEEWSCRESAFKALTPDNEGLLMSQMKRISPGTLNVFSPKGDRSVQTRAAWAGKWVLSMAWRPT